jgi:hypothetical protein
MNEEPTVHMLLNLCNLDADSRNLTGTVVSALAGSLPPVQTSAIESPCSCHFSHYVVLFL